MFTDSFAIPHPLQPPANVHNQQLNQPSSGLYNDRTFYAAFLKDLRSAKREVIICSPFVTKYRFQFFRRTLKELQCRNIAVFIFTRAIVDQEFGRRLETRSALADFEAAGAFVIQLPGAVHEKVAIIDREILWEGSLNILSQRESRELMRRTVGSTAAHQVMTYLHLNGKIADGYRQQYERLCHGLMNQANRRIGQRRLALVAGLSSIAIGFWLMVHGTSMMKSVEAAINIIRLLNMSIR